MSNLRDAISDGLYKANKAYEIEDVIDAIEDEILTQINPVMKLQAIAEAYQDLKNAVAHPVDDSHVRKMRECLDYLLDALVAKRYAGRIERMWTP